MNNNQLYTHFKERKHQFDEMPGAILWDKIEQHLESPARRPPSRGLLTTLATLTGFFLIVLTICILIPNPATLGLEKVSTQPIKEVSVEQNVTTLVPLEQNISDTVKGKLKYKPFSKTVTAMNSSNDSIAIAVDVPEPGNSNLTSVAPDDAEVQLLPGKIRVKALRELSQAEYDRLLDQCLKIYSDKPDSILIIVAEGHKPYRKTIEKGLREKQLLEHPQIRNLVRHRNCLGDTLRTQMPVLVPFQTIDFKPVKPLKKPKRVFVDGLIIEKDSL